VLASTTARFTHRFSVNQTCRALAARSACVRLWLLAGLGYPGRIPADSSTNHDRPWVDFAGDWPLPTSLNHQFSVTQTVPLEESPTVVISVSDLPLPGCFPTIHPPSRCRTILAENQSRYPRWAFSFPIVLAYNAITPNPHLQTNLRKCLHSRNRSAATQTIHQCRQYQRRDRQSPCHSRSLSPHRHRIESN
jgi:hypothetical protein